MLKIYMKQEMLGNSKQVRQHQMTHTSNLHNTAAFTDIPFVLSNYAGIGSSGQLASGAVF